MFSVIRQCRINDGYLFHLWKFIWKWPVVRTFPRGLYDSCLFSYNQHVIIGIQLSWGHFSIIFISHCCCCLNHIHISAPKSIVFYYPRPLIIKWSKSMRGAGRTSFLNRLTWFDDGSLKEHSCHAFHQFGGNCWTGDKSFSIIDLCGLHCFSGSNARFNLLARRHGGIVITDMSATIRDCSSDTISDFPFFPDFYLDVNYFKADMILARSLPF